MTTSTTAKTNGNGTRTRRAGEPTVAIERISPTTAKKWLEGNIRNRNLREGRVHHLVGILERGEWELTGDSIVFDQEGVLLNGQHRLTAIAEGGYIAPVVVLRNIPTEAQDVMDRGLPRKLADALKLRGFARTFTLAAALGWMHRLEYIKRTKNVHYATADQRPTSPQALAVLDANPDLPEYMKYSDKVCKELRLRQGLCTALYYTFAGIDEDDADDFFEQLESGLGFALKKQDPVYLLRRVMISNMSATIRMPDYREAATICKAWNLWREGKPVQSLAWRYGGTQREDFPIPK